MKSDTRTNDWFVTQQRPTVLRWRDLLIEQHGYPVRDPYVERFWLPILGPSCIVVARRLSGYIGVVAEGVTIDLAELAASMGLKNPESRNGSMVRTLVRLVDFGMAKTPVQDGNITGLAIRTHFPPLSMRHVERLPLCLHAAHEIETARRAA